MYDVEYSTLYKEIGDLRGRGTDMYFYRIPRKIKGIWLIHKVWVQKEMALTVHGHVHVCLCNVLVHVHVHVHVDLR